jgi:hypothetical protein
MMATRSDENLDRAFRPFMKTWIKSARATSERIAGRLGIADVDQIEHMIRLHRAAMAGFALELMFARDGREVEGARTLLRDFNHALVDGIIAKEAVKTSRKTRRPANRAG